MISFAEAYKVYSFPYKFLQELKRLEGIEEADIFKYFVKIEYKILNKDGAVVSGGERSEFIDNCLNNAIMGKPLGGSAPCVLSEAVMS